jgi:hypothetical protein
VAPGSDAHLARALARRQRHLAPSTYTNVHISVAICKGKKRASEDKPSAGATAWRKSSSGNEFWRALPLTKQWHTEAIPPRPVKSPGWGSRRTMPLDDIHGGGVDYRIEEGRTGSIRRFAAGHFCRLLDERAAARGGFSAGHPPRSNSMWPTTSSSRPGCAALAAAPLEREPLTEAPSSLPGRR